MFVLEMIYNWQTLHAMRFELKIFLWGIYQIIYPADIVRNIWQMLKDFVKILKHNNKDGEVSANLVFKNIVIVIVIIRLEEEPIKLRSCRRSLRGRKSRRGAIWNKMVMVMVQHKMLTRRVPTCPWWPCLDGWRPPRWAEGRSSLPGDQHHD